MRVAKYRCTDFLFEVLEISIDDELLTNTASLKIDKKIMLRQIREGQRRDGRGGELKRGEREERRGEREDRTGRGFEKEKYRKSKIKRKIKRER